MNSRGNSGGGIFNGITVPLICPSRRPSAPSAERPAAPPAALRRGFARPGRCFAPGDALRPSPDILRRIHPTPLLERGRAASDGDGRDATFPAGCAGAPPPPASACIVRGGQRRRGARTPRMPWQGRAAASPAQGRRESVLPPARPHSADSGEFKADALARRARQPVSTPYCTARRADGGRTALRCVFP